MNISQLNLRGRMAYGVDCFINYLKQNELDTSMYKDEIDILSQYTSATNLADWDVKAKKLIYEKYSDTVLSETIPNMIDKLYWIGAGELYGQPSDCNESEKNLEDIIRILSESNITVPSINLYSTHALDSPTSTDDYFGVPFEMEAKTWLNKSE